MIVGWGGPHININDEAGKRLPVVGGFLLEPAATAGFDAMKRALGWVCGAGLLNGDLRQARAPVPLAAELSQVGRPDWDGLSLLNLVAPALAILVSACIGFTS